jgi:hypothetical protein
MLLGRNYTKEMEEGRFVFRPVRKDFSDWDKKYIGNTLHAICNDSMKYEKLYEKYISSLKTNGFEMNTIGINRKSPVPKMNYVIEVDSEIKKRTLDQALSGSYYDYEKNESWLSEVEDRHLRNKMAILQTGPATLFSHGLYSLIYNLTSGNNYLGTPVLEMVAAGIAAFGVGFHVCLSGPFPMESLNNYIPKMRDSGKLRVEIE